MKRVLTIDEAVEYTGFKKSYLYQLTSAGVIPHSKPNGKMIFFDRGKLEDWLLSNPKKGIADLKTEAANYITTHQ